MINCRQCGAKYPEREGLKYCVQCGSGLQKIKQETIICIQCKNSIKPSSNCSICGLAYSKTELLLLKEIRSLKNAISTISRDDINTDLLDDASVSSSDLPIYQQEEVEQQSILEEHISLEEEPIVIDPKDVIESPLPNDVDAGTITEPNILTISKPTGFNLEYQREKHPEPIDLPGFTTKQTVIEEKTLIQRTAELVEGPFLTVMGVFTAVMTMIFFAQVVGWNSLFQGYVFSIIGIILIFAGYTMVIGKFPFFGPERGLGLLVSSIGYVLAEVFSLGTGNLYIIAVISIIGTGLIVYIGFKQYSEIMVIEATILTLLLPILTANLSGISLQMLSLISTGGGSIFIVISGGISIYAGKREISYFPALINLALGPIIPMTIINNLAIDIFNPSIGICLSIIPIAILIFADKILILDFYYDLLLKMIIAYPVVVFFTLNFNENGFYRELDPLIFFIGYITSLGVIFYSTESFSPVFTELKQSNMNTVTAAIPIVAILVGFAILENKVDSIEWGISMVGFVGMSYLIPIIYNQYDGLFLDFKILDGILAIISSTFLLDVSGSTITSGIFLGTGILLLIVAIIRFSLEHFCNENSIFDNEAIHLFIFLFILNFAGTNQYLVLLPLFGLFAIPLLFSSVNDLDRLKSYTNLVVTKIAILSSYFLMISGFISNAIQINFLIVILTFVSVVVISGGILYILRIDSSKELPIVDRQNKCD